MEKKNALSNEKTQAYQVSDAGTPRVKLPAFTYLPQMILIK